MTTVYIISAPSGSGKSTIVDELRSQVVGLNFSISYTTRAPRGSEQNGREYFFISRAEFESMIGEDEFLEYADVSGTTTGRLAAFCARRRTKAQTCCSTSMCRERPRFKARFRTRPAFSCCRPIARFGMAFAQSRLR